MAGSRSDISWVARAAMFWGVIFVAGFLFVVSLLFTGSGHGTDVFIRVILSPMGSVETVGMQWLVLGLWPVIALSLCVSDLWRLRYVFRVVLGIHYLGVLFLVFTGAIFGHYVKYVFRVVPMEALGWVGIYLGLHGVMWLVHVKMTGIHIRLPWVKRESRDGLVCAQCGYDLRGSQGQGACPECGGKVRGEI